MPTPGPARSTGRRRLVPVVLLYLSSWAVHCDSGAAPRPAPQREAIPHATADLTSPSEVEAAPEAAAPAQVGPRVVFLGDSLAAGLHLPADQAFPAVLQRRLAAEGAPFTLSNAGVSGDTTSGGLRRVAWVLRGGADIVVVELGANDGLRGVPLATIEKNLRAIIEQARSAGARPLLLGVRLPPSYGAKYAGGFDAMYARIGESMDVPFVPYFMRGVAGVAALNLPDGLHPTAEGHEKLADNVADALQELVLELR